MNEPYCQTRTILNEIKRYELAGKYDLAANLLENNLRLDTIPENLNSELYLRRGSVTMYLGNSRQIPDSNKKAKNFIIKAKSLFSSEKNSEKMAECENFLALTYYYTAKYSKANTCINNALKINKNVNETRLHSYLIKSMLLLINKKYESVIEFLESVNGDFECGNYLFQGSVAINKSVAYKNLGDTDKAYDLLKIARKFLIKSNHILYLAMVENTLAQVYKIRRNFSKALKASENSIKLFTEIEDRLRQALAIETKAEILIELGDYEQATLLCNEALKILKSGDSSSIISSIYITKAIALLHSQKKEEALLNVSSSIKYAYVDSEETTVNVFNKFLQTWEKTVRMGGLFLQLDKDTNHTIKLILPNSIPKNEKIHCVLVKNNNLFELNILKGMIAIVLNCPVSVGDLAAVTDKKTGLASVGFFDREWGMICLESALGADLFQECDVDILGRVIGYTENKPNINGEHIVTLLD